MMSGILRRVLMAGLLSTRRLACRLAALDWASFFFFFKSSGPPRDLPSSPPRPSPDLEPATVEHGVRDTQLLGPPGQHLSHGFGCGDVGPVLQVLPHFLIARRDRDERMAAAVVHELRVDMARGPKNVQTRRLSAAASPLAGSLMNPAARQGFWEQFSHVSSGP